MRSKRSEKGRAVATLITTAPKNNLQDESYRKCAPKASENLKEKIGELLLTLQAPLSQEQQKKYWQLFESILRQYLDLRICEVVL